MSNTIRQSLFQTAEVKSSWRGQLTSGLVHASILILLFAIAVPVTREIQKPAEHIMLIAPQLPQYRARITPPRQAEQPRLIVSRSAPTPKPIFKAPEVLRVVPARPLPAAVNAPAIRQPQEDVKIMAEAKPELPPPPKPLVKTGIFQTADLAKGVVSQKQLTVGGFGDPHGVPVSATSRPAPVMMAKVGLFEQQEGAGGHSQSGGVRQSSFGSVGEPPSAEGSTGGGGRGQANGSVESAGFDDTLALAQSPRKVEQSNTPAFTPVAILFKPRPAYTVEARNMRLEGQVSLEVVFQASGSVRVVRIIRGLGHGLDEAAQVAALQVRFKPATRGGMPVDTNATISITFELT